MFTGIIATTGRIARLAPQGDVLRLTLDAGKLPLEDVALGDSIAVNGICLTVVALGAGTFEVDVSPETLRCTVGLDNEGNLVNLEKAMQLTDRLGGHLVSGHVDGVGQVKSLNQTGECLEVVITAPPELARYIATKGSVTVNGVSLTTNLVQGDDFNLMLIPHTLEKTNLHQLAVGQRVNLEVDLIARYCERILSYQASTQA